MAAANAGPHGAVLADAKQNGWCYDAGIVDPVTHPFYLADAANKRITVITPRSGQVKEIGAGRFTGIAKCLSVISTEWGRMAL